MKILNYEYWIQYIVYESKLNDIYIMVSEKKAIEVFNKIEDKLKNIKIELSLKETDKIIKNELDTEIDKIVKNIKLNAELKIIFTLNEYGNIMFNIQKMDYQAIINLKTHGDKVEYYILKNNERFEGSFTINDFLNNYEEIKLEDIIHKNMNSILIQSQTKQELSICLVQKLSDFKESKGGSINLNFNI